MKTATDPKPVMIIQRSNVGVANEGFTYNEAGKIYNDTMMYGGLYGRDILPMVAEAKPSIPTSQAISDLPNTLAVRILYRGMAMGLLHDLTYSTSEVVYL